MRPSSDQGGPSTHVLAVQRNSLGVSIEVPKGATLSAAGDITTGKLSASLFVPPINQTVTFLGLPIKIKGSHRANAQRPAR
jgi:hypothetical protein